MAYEKSVRVPEISVIIPVYNSERYLIDSVQSVRRQTVQNIQVILIEDGSFDDSLSYCEKLAEMDDRIEVYRQKKNQGVSAARNLGLNAAKGKYVAFADADDILDEDMLETLLDEIEGNSQADMAVCGYYIDSKPQLKKNSIRKILTAKEVAKEVAGIQGSFVKGYVVNKLFKREILVRYNILFDEESYICEDLLFCLQYILHSRMAVYNPLPKYHYMTRDGSAMHGGVTPKRMTVVDTYRKILDIGLMYQDEKLNRLLLAGYWNHYISILKDVVKSADKEQKMYGDVVYPYVKKITCSFIASKDTSLKRKVLLLLLRIIYPFWQILPLR